MSVAAPRLVQRTEAVRPIVVVDDHELLGQTLVTTLERAGIPARAVFPLPPDDEVILSEIERLRPSIVLLDLDLGPGIGIALHLIEPMKAVGARVVIMTGQTDRIRLAECIEAGADGLLSKADPFDRLLADIEVLTRRGTMLPVATREALLGELRLHRANEATRLEPFERLTVREAEVLCELMDGMSSERISELGFISISTVRSHIKAILRKLDVSSQLAAVATAQRAGWVGATRPKGLDRPGSPLLPPAATGRSGPASDTTPSGHTSCS